ncbi:MAG: TIGR01777 family oxidoreductase [Candidatus Eisenbacteria bacterium]
MRILISGSSGLIGTEMVRALTTRGDSVLRLVRRGPARAGTTVLWDPGAGKLDPREVEGVDAVLNLSGENIGGGRWTRERKRRILESRVRSTSLLASTLARLDRRPQVFVSASAMDYYGDRGDDPLTEEAPPGAGFLSDVVTAWEQAADPARQAGIRVAHPRSAMVLSGKGGALAPLLRAFRLGLGGPMGSGRQFWSWIAIQDVVSALQLLIDRADLSGPFNLASPAPARQREFASTLGRVLGRPAFLPAPGWGLRILLGEMAGPLLLHSKRLVPARLQSAGYRFVHPELESALRAAIEEDGGGG